MNMMTLYRMAVVLGIGAALLAKPAIAADKPGKEQKRLQQMLHKAEQEKSQLTEQKAEIEGQLKEVQNKLEVTQRKATSKIGRISKELETVTIEREALATKLTDSEKQLAETTVKLKQTETDKSNLEATGIQLRDTISRCEGNNAKLYQYGTELLGQYEHKGCGAALLQAEPVTGLKRVEIENMIEDYHDKLDGQRWTPVSARDSKPDRPGS